MIARLATALLATATIVGCSTSTSTVSSYRVNTDRSPHASKFVSSFGDNVFRAPGVRAMPEWHNRSSRFLLSISDLRATQVTIQESSGYPLYDELMAKWIRNWTFTEEICGGKRSCNRVVPLMFQLDVLVGKQ
jgi:hypothetical protein